MGNRKEWNEKKGKINGLFMFRNLLDSLWYNRDDTYMFTLVERIIKYITESGREYVQDEYMEDMDILWGTLVITYGDYGTSPRYGWIEDKYKPSIKIALEAWLNLMKGEEK